MPENNVVKRKRREDREIAYFSMEVGINPHMPTYSGGLGVLAGGTIRSCADLNVPMVAVTLLYKKGYFTQKLDAQGNQQETPADWQPQDFLKLLPEKVEVTIEKRKVYIQAWEYHQSGMSGYFVPVVFLDTDLEENAPEDRNLCQYLYGGDKEHRLSQEIILGIGGVRMLGELGFNHLVRYHMNEGHASLLTLELLRERQALSGPEWDIEGVKKSCVFTTHTPVPAGHDQFSYDLVANILGELVPLDLMKKLGGEDRLNMTLLALNLSGYVNGVAKEHRKVSEEMFPGYHIDFITNGVHSARWVAPSFKDLFDRYIPGWAYDPFSLRYALSIPRDQIWSAHEQAKKVLMDYVNAKYNVNLGHEVLTIGFARRATAYKRADLVFANIERLRDIAQRSGKIQFIFAGKAHPKDWPGKELIKKIFSLKENLNNSIKVVYLEEYNLESAKVLIAGVDVWLNTPRRPQEASGTSGMKAAHNGVPSLSILDGWWIEGCIEGVTGWAIGSVNDIAGSDEKEAELLYEKLENTVLPVFYNNRQQWIDIMRHAIAINASFFNTHRMVQQYVLNAYL
ncbi:MAG: alpha-glucan family phosphorylase [Candidatus Omnitrophota bacterium]